MSLGRNPGLLRVRTSMTRCKKRRSILAGGLAGIAALAPARDRAVEPDAAGVLAAAREAPEASQGRLSDRTPALDPKIRAQTADVGVAGGVDGGSGG